jgi:hypothetical protein
MHPEVERLAILVEAASSFLHTYGEEHWSAWLSKDASRIHNLELYGLQHLLGAFGGMGSISDLLLHPANGHKVPETEVDRVNEELRSMLCQVYDLAQKLYREELAAKGDT